MIDKDFYSKYVKYINSDNWREVRYSYLSDNPYCEVCKSEFLLNVHHLNYSSFEYEEPEDLMTLCARCHKAVHAIFRYDEHIARDDNREDIKETLSRYYKIQNKLLFNTRSCKVCGYTPKICMKLRVVSPIGVNKYVSILNKDFNSILVVCENCSRILRDIDMHFKTNIQDMIDTLQCKDTLEHPIFDGYCPKCKKLVDIGNIEVVKRTPTVKVDCGYCKNISYVKYFNPTTCQATVIDAYLKGYFTEYPEKSTLMKRGERDKNGKLPRRSKKDTRTTYLV